MKDGTAQRLKAVDAAHSINCLSFKGTAVESSISFVVSVQLYCIVGRAAGGGLASAQQCVEVRDDGHAKLKIYSSTQKV